MTSAKKILLFGSNGMLGQRLTDRILKDNKYELYCSSFEDESFVDGVNYTKADITSKDDLRNLIKGIHPNIIINAAAYTNVDKAEEERELCWNINVKALEYISMFCKVLEDIHLVHVSTDYVFDGNNGPYSEDDRLNPIGYYAKSKLAGENAVIASGIKYTIIRTNVLYGPAKKGRPDFVKWVIDSVRAGKQINIVDDQINNPTFLDDLANGIFLAVDKNKQGIFHVGGKEFLNRFDFTLRIADYFNLDKALIKPITTAELKQKAKRPLKSGLKVDKATKELGYKPTDVEQTFEIMKQELGL